MARGGGVRQDEVDGLADGEDLRRLLVGHLHAVGVLELQDERVEIQRIDFQIGLEARAVVDPLGIDVQLVDKVALDEGEHFLSGHDADTVEALPDIAARGVNGDVVGRTHDALERAGALRKARAVSERGSTVSAS